ncbi:MAG: hypothetical protein ACT6TH_14805 [Brevundimonas sp.]|uniref:Uncharacterized protein n=1 Tax=Brevundimonas aurantiaca TaxID=74316 RepID=A0A7W9F709_9CAUL|nr:MULTISPECIES: hypothetical protein [Brevundimonas]MBU1538889.1 hypothetical protein [Alphaproteobacteria bacterium]OGN51937.1 MAG: hypothetical protein A2352_03850 [Caulobacterales bacterium RIFOXYB1_FULL_67_16]OYX36603.1 MAG: hypothetical protein B7Y99_00590 [Caulobacterales bacterium 32-69-10]ALJ09447.1 hypothetical protein JL11_14720 [Brevundimonas sp. DS20]MBB5738551.1 hypothetical protein [Brevundimonas aurantiaca]
MHVTAAAMVMVRQHRHFALVGGVDRRVCGGRGFSVDLVGVIVPVVVMIMVSRGIAESDAGELESMFYSMLTVTYRKALQRDHKGHGQADADLADKSRQESTPYSPGLSRHP